MTEAVEKSFLSNPADRTLELPGGGGTLTKGTLFLVAGRRGAFRVQWINRDGTIFAYGPDQHGSEKGGQTFRLKPKYRLEAGRKTLIEKASKITLAQASEPDKEESLDR